MIRSGRMWKMYSLGQLQGTDFDETWINKRIAHLLGDYWSRLSIRNPFKRSTPRPSKCCFSDSISNEPYCQLPHKRKHCQQRHEELLILLIARVGRCWSGAIFWFFPATSQGESIELFLGAAFILGCVIVLVACVTGSTSCATDTH